MWYNWVLEVDMPICPYCNKESKTLHSKFCPKCDRLLYEYEGNWYTSNPILAMMDKYSERMSILMSASKPFDVKFRFKTKSLMYKTEIARTKQLFKEAGLDIDVALEAIDLAFYEFSWRMNGNMADLVPVFPACVARAKAKVEYEREQLEKQKIYEQMLRDRESALNG